MMYPILCNVRYETLHIILRQKTLWKQIGFSVIINWIVAPFFMVCPLNTPYFPFIPFLFKGKKGTGTRRKIIVANEL